MYKVGDNKQTIFTTIDNARQSYRGSLTPCSASHEMTGRGCGVGACACCRCSLGGRRGLPHACCEGEFHGCWLEPDISATPDSRAASPPGGVTRVGRIEASTSNGIMDPEEGVQIGYCTRSLVDYLLQRQLLTWPNPHFQPKAHVIKGLNVVPNPLLERNRVVVLGQLPREPSPIRGRHCSRRRANKVLLFISGGRRDDGRCRQYIRLTACKSSASTSSGRG